MRKGPASGRCARWPNSASAAIPASFGVIEDDCAEGHQSKTALAGREAAKGKAFVDFQNDVRVDDLALAVREGYDHVELAKRYTTNGMATDQGKLSNINAIGILAEARGVSPAAVGTTTFRPFYTPVSFGALAGHHRGHAFQPVRRSPLDAWAQRHGAVFVEAGLWMRSSYFPRAGETHWRETVDREALTVRATVGLCDVSTLGKIEIVGTGRGDVSRPGLLQRLRQAAGRQGALWLDVARRRLRL